MNRRKILGTAAAAAPATIALAAPAIAQTQNPEVRWRLQSSFPRNLDILFFGAEQVSTGALNTITVAGPERA